MNTTNSTALYAVVMALEKRFPKHNGPFEYATRLAEEVGELIELLYKDEKEPLNTEQKRHLAKEQQDVLRVIVGILAVYNQTNIIPRTIDDFAANNTAPTTTNDLIAQLSIACGELASAINHAEGMGVKTEKHGHKAGERIAKQATVLASITVKTIRHFTTARLVDEHITHAYNDYKKQGFID